MHLQRALGWAATGTAIGQTSSLLRLLLVTSVITIDDLGKYAIAASIAGAAGMLGDGGLRQQYLSRQTDWISDGEGAVLSTVWVGMLAGAIGAGVLTIPIALSVSSFFGHDQFLLVWMSITLATCSVLTACRNPEQTHQERLGNLGPSIKAETHGQILALIAVVALAFLWHSVWLLIIGQLIAAFVTAVLSYFTTSRRPLRGVNVGTLVALLVKGRPFTVMSIATYITAGLDKLLLGTMLSSAVAGTFFLAQRLSDAPRQLHASVLGRAALPYLAHQQQHHGALKVQRDSIRYLYTTVAIFVVGAVVALLGFAILPNFTIGRKWIDVLALLPILLVGVGARAGCHTIAPSLILAGRVDIDAQMKVEESAVYLVLLPVAIIAGGATGAALSFTGIYICALLRRYSAMCKLV